MVAVAKLKRMARKHGWKILDEQPDIGLVSFRKEIDGYPARINVYTTKMTVGTALNHPKQGKTQLFRKKVDEDLMCKIFDNPRVHTTKGYQRR